MDQDIYKVKIKVTSQKGTCVAGHKVGDEFETLGLTPPGLCIFAFSAILPSLMPLMFGGNFFWSKDKDVTEVVCPDGGNPVVFELRRVRKAAKQVLQDRHQDNMILAFSDDGIYYCTLRMPWIDEDGIMLDYPDLFKLVRENG